MWHQVNTDRMVAAYLQAVDFTETGDNEQPESGTDLTPLFKAEAYRQCRNFLWAIGEVVGYPAVEGVDTLDPERLGHDLWLTRNGHGAGFWDRPEIYGEANAILFTRIAKAMGSHDAEFV